MPKHIVTIKDLENLEPEFLVCSSSSESKKLVGKVDIQENIVIYYLYANKELVEACSELPYMLEKYNNL